MADATNYSKSHIEKYVKNHMFHDIVCGFDHCKRVYMLAKKLGKTYDDNVLHAAAFLHDIAINQPNHHEKSAERAANILKGMLDLHKIQEVKEAIMNHGIEGKPKSPEAILIHDADLLDYLGATGILRLTLAAKAWYDKKDIYEIFELIRALKNNVANAIILNQSKSLAADKLLAMDMILEQAEEEL